MFALKPKSMMVSIFPRINFCLRSCRHPQEKWNNFWFEFRKEYPLPQNSSIAARVKLVHLKVDHKSNLMSSKYTYRSRQADRFWVVKNILL